MEQPTCSSCHYWKVNDNQEGPDGWCCRFPPSVVVMDMPAMPGMPGARPGPDVHSFMPATLKDWWCGEHKGKPSASGSKSKKRK